MGLDLVGSWILSFFGACLAGGIVGFALGKLIDFEFGLGVGLLVPGIVSLSFTWSFATEYREFRDSPSRAEAVVVAREDRAVNASGSVTTPVAVLEFAAADGARHRVTSAGGSSLRVGDTAEVVYDARDPDRAKIGSQRELLGGAIASLLFGTFPASAGLFYWFGWLAERRPRARTDRQIERASTPTRLTWYANVVMLAGLVGAGLWPGPVLEQILVAFGAVALGLWIHVADGVRMGRDARWTLGIGVLALNFSVWVLALWLLREPASPW